MFLESAALALITCYTPLVGKIGNNKFTEYGPLFFWFGLHFILYSVAVAVISILKYRNVRGFERLQLRYFYLGLSVALILVSINNIIVPAVFGSHHYERFGILAPLFVCLPVAYTIIRYRFLDIRFVIGKFIFFVTLSVFSAFAFYSLYFLEIYLFGGIFTPEASGLDVIEAPLFTALFLWIANRMQNLLNTTLIYVDYNPNNLKNEFFARTNNILELRKLVAIYEDIINKSIKPERLDIIIFNELGELIFTNRTYTKNNFSYHFIKKITKNTHEQLFVYNEVLNAKQKFFKQNKIGDKLLGLMKKNSYEVILTSGKSQSFVSFIGIGSKGNQSAYDSEDISFLKNLLTAFIVTIERSILYLERLNFEDKLKYKVEQATKKLRKQKAQLQEKYQFERDMMGIMGHELRTPLTVAKGNSELLLTKAKGNIPMNSDYIADKVDSIHDSILKEADLIQIMLSTSHIDNNKLSFQLGPVNLEECINYAVMAFTKEADKKKLSLKYEKPDFIVPEIISDSSRTQEVITNLISNAVKYTTKGFIKVYLEKTKEYLIVHVKDSGIGIPKEEIENIGKKFYRIHQHLDKEKEIVRAGGTGLGLYVVKGILEGLGGELRIKSEEGVGSTFSAVFPYQAKVEDNIILKPKRNEENDLFKVLKFPKNQKPIILKRTQE